MVRSMSRHHAALNRWKLAEVRAQRLELAAINEERCCLCDGPIDYTLDGRTKWGPTVEHRPSLDDVAEAIAAGLHDPYALEHLLPAHRHCNSSDGSRRANLRRKGERALNTSRAW